jgi:hypothetical protein
MAKIKVWARVGITFDISIDKIPDDGILDQDQMDEIAKEVEALIQTIKKVPHCNPDGESYIPEGCVHYEVKGEIVRLENPETDLLA